MDSERVKCPYCAEEINQEAKKCRFCGEWINTDSYPFSPENQVSENYELVWESEEAEADELNLFVGDRSDYYIKKWEMSDQGKGIISWNWAAATGILWLGYRKMYGYATALLGLFLVALLVEVSLGDVYGIIGKAAFLLSFIVIGLYGNHLYHRYTLRSIAKFRFEPLPIKNRLLQKNGGTSQFAAGLLLVIALSFIFLPPYVIQDMVSRFNRNVAATETATNGSPNSTPAVSGESASGPPATLIKLDNQDFERLFPGWLLLTRQGFFLDGRSFSAVAMGRMVQNDNSPAAGIRIAICDNSDKKWSETWHIPKDLISDCSDAVQLKNNPKVYVQNMTVTTSGNTVLVVADVLVGGAHGTTQVIAFTYNQKEKGLVRVFDSAGIMTIEKQGEKVLVTGEGDYGTHKLYLENGVYKQERVALSEMAPSNSVKARFIIGGYDSIAYPVEGKIIKLKVGQTIAFVPGDDKARKLFDDGEIMIYSDAWNGPPLSPSEANRIKTGNSYQFDTAGTFNFLLLNGSSSGIPTTDYTPTFTAVVSP